MDEELINKIKNKWKKWSKLLLKIVIIIPLIVIIILVASVYQIILNDGTYEEGNWSNTQYGVSQYTNNTSISQNGNITSNMTAQELWDKMIQEDSRVSLYLDGPEELLKLMNAQLVTQYLDTRPNPDDPIDWDSMTDIHSNVVQGIIKLKRAQSDGTTITMTYVDPQTFQNYIDAYNSSGLESDRNRVLSHFTLEAGAESQITGNATIDSLDGIIFIGDSFTEGLEQAQIIKNASFYSEIGVTPQYWIDHLEELPTDSDEVKGVCVLLGGSDPDQIDEMRDLITELTKRYPNKSVYVQEVFPVGTNYTTINKDEFNAKIQNFNDKIKEYCEVLNNVEFIDTTEGYVDENGVIKDSVLQSDGMLLKNYEDLAYNIEQEIVGNSDTDNNGTNTNGTTNTYYAKVATWSEITDTVQSDDPDVASYSTTTYNMTTRKINYQDFVSGYTMPFDYLWDLLVISGDQGFVLDLADLVYNSEIEITVYDNLSTNTNVNTYTYTENKKIVSKVSRIDGFLQQGEEKERVKIAFPTEELEQINPINRTVTHTTINRSNTLDIALTKANVWIVNYTKEYMYTVPQTIQTSGGLGALDEISYTNVPDHTTNTDDIGFGNMLAENYYNQWITEYPLIQTEVVGVSCDYYYSTTNRNESITNTLEKNTYVASPPNIDEKTDKNSTDPNFVTVLLDEENTKAKHHLLETSSWLFTLLQRNDSTSDMVDLTKYLLYKATEDTKYWDPDEEFDFSIYDPINFQSITTGADGGLSLSTTMFTKEVFTQALQAYYNKTGDQAFYNNFLLKVDELYDASVANNVNPELVVITAKTEGSFKEAGGSYNYWGVNVPNGASSGDSYTSLADGIAGYARYIQKYETDPEHIAVIMQRYEERKAAGCDPLGYGLPGTLSGMQSRYSWVGDHVYGDESTGGYYIMDPDRAGITKIYATHEEFEEKCLNGGPEHAPGAPPTVWEQGQYTAWQVEQKLKVWNEIFGDFGSLTSSSSDEVTEIGAKIVEEARKQLGVPYVWGGVSTSGFDCSGLVVWCYEKIGISITHYSGAQKDEAIKRLPVSEARVGDVLWRSGHVAIYIGNNQYIHAPEPGGVVEISSDINNFSLALQFY